MEKNKLKLTCLLRKMILIIMIVEKIAFKTKANIS